MECLIIICNGIVDAKKFSNTDTNIDTVHLNFKPQKSDEEIEEIIIKKKKKKVNFTDIGTDTDYDTDKDNNKLISTNNIK